MSNFKPTFIGEASFANGSKFMIEQIKRGGSCKVTDLKTGQSSYSGSIAKAWGNVRYQAQVRPDTHNTHGWPKNRGIY